jgi:hypothetical protein
LRWMMRHPGSFHPSGDVVTWRHLLEHRAGFLDKRLDPSQPEASIPVVPPGLLYVYSNEGYAASGAGAGGGLHRD